MSIKKLKSKIVIKGQIELLTGLSIGGTNNQMGIGGVDKMIIRNPLNNKPIIPGSSLKGKMRALLELAHGKYNLNEKDKGEVGNDPFITKLFGASAADKDDAKHASRLIVRDAELSNEDDTRWSNTDMLYSEAKTEVSINRLTSKASPRTFERVPAGAIFNMEMVVNIVCEDGKEKHTEKELCSLLSEGMKLLQNDYLGGNGSRGYGQIAFRNVTLTQLNYSDKITEPSKVSDDIANLFKDFSA